jgi:hypothetical protein
LTNAANAMLEQFCARLKLEVCRGKAIGRVLRWKMGCAKLAEADSAEATIIQSLLTVISEATTRGRRKEGEERRCRTSRR